MTRTKQSERSPLRIIVGIVAVIVVILFVSAGLQIKDHSEGYTIEYDTRDYIYAAERGSYGNLYDVALRDMDRHATYSPEVAECRALAFYYEQALLEHAYRAAGDDKKADEFAKRMEEYEAQLGSMSSKAKLVRKSVSG